jgi:hypothetical protein
MNQPAEQKPWKAGVVAGRHRFSTEKVRAAEQKLSAAADLQDFAKEHRLFSPALMYLSINLAGRDPLADFGDETNHNVVPVKLTFDQPLFSGLWNGWDSTLFAMPLGVGDEFIRWAGTLTFVDRDQRTVSRLRYKELEIVDPLWLAKRVVCDTNALQHVPVTMFCVDSNVGCLYFESNPFVFGHPPRVKFGQPFPDTQVLAQAIFNDHDKPLQAAEEVHTVDGVTLAEREIMERVARVRSQGETTCPEVTTTTNPTTLFSDPLP